MRRTDTFGILGLFTYLYFEAQSEQSNEISKV
jgi:hypothetical protein